MVFLVDGVQACHCLVCSTDTDLTDHADLKRIHPKHMQEGHFMLKSAFRHNIIPLAWEETD